MEKKLPSIYSNKTDKKFKNNENVYYTKNEEKIEETISNKNETIKNDKIDIMKKINKIFNSPNYVYKMDVLIKINNEEKEYRIIGKNQKDIITYDNKLIPINQIEDIKIKKEE